MQHIGKLLDVVLVGISVAVFATGILSDDLHTSLAGVIFLFLGNVLFGCLNVRARLLFLLLHGGIFLFLLTRPLVGSLDSDAAWFLSSRNSTFFALGSIYVSMICLLLGALLYEGITHYNQDRQAHRDRYRIKKPQHPFPFSYKKTPSASLVIGGSGKKSAIGYIRVTTSVLFLICFLASLCESLQVLSCMQGHVYEEYYLMNFSQPWMIGTLSYMMPFMLCAYLATLPRRAPTTLLLFLYTVSTIPMLMIGSRSGLVLAILFAVLYYGFRMLTDTEERWITKSMVIAAAVVVPLGIAAMGMVNYMRAGSVTDLGFFPLIADALYKQGVSFDVLGHGFDVNSQIQALGFKFFVMGSFISNITDGFIGQTFLHCPSLGDTNSALLALNGHSYAHTMSYFAHPNYLGGEGYGSSYILELFADFGWIGIAAGSFLLGGILCLLSRLIGKNWFGGTIALIAALSVFHMPRGSAMEWIAFIWTTRFLLAMALIIVGSATLAYVSQIGAKNDRLSDKRVWTKERLSKAMQRRVNNILLPKKERVSQANIPAIPLGALRKDTRYIPRLGDRRKQHV